MKVIGPELGLLWFEPPWTRY